MFDFVNQTLGTTSVLMIGTALISFAIFLIVYELSKEDELRAAADNLNDTGAIKKIKDPILMLALPAFQYFVSLVKGKKRWDEKRQIYRAKIISAGLKEVIDADGLITFKLALAVMLPIALLLLKVTEIFEAPDVILYLSPVFGFFYPDLWVKRLITARQEEIRKSLPFVVDLLALSTEAGLDFIGAIGRVVEKAKPSPIVDELSQLLKEIKVGSSRAAALRDFAERIDMSEINSFVAILISADQMGASIGRILRQQSEQVRNDRMLRAERKGASITPKLQVVTIFVIMPAVMLMIAGPYVLQFFSGGGGP